MSLTKASRGSAAARFAIAAVTAVAALLSAGLASPLAAGAPSLPPAEPAPAAAVSPAAARPVLDPTAPWSPVVGAPALDATTGSPPAAAEPALDAATAAPATVQSDDIVEKVAFGPGGLRRLSSIEVGSWPTEIEGPHGLAVSPDGEYWYVSIAHGQPGPGGSIVKYATADDSWLGEVEVGMFPATMAISPTIGLLYVVNFNLHGLPEPSSISVVDPESMSEVGRVDVGVMPHGARMNRQGTRLYTVNMMDDVLVEVDTYRMEVTRQLGLSMHGRHKIDGTDEQHMAAGEGTGEHAGHEGAAAPMAGMQMDMANMVKPTWATAPTPQGKLYVAGNGAAKILEIDVESWEITRELATPAGPYNLDVSADGSLLAATYKSSRAVGFWDLEKGEEVGRVETLRPIPHGIVISPDGRYAFATIEGIGGEPGSVEAYDLRTFERVAHLDIAKQAGGIAFWRID
jgi:DNA-binding beta-propeller fold protein YncE